MTPSAKPLNRRALFAGILPLVLFGYAVTASQQASKPRVDYLHDVQPIFKAHCFRCHSGTAPSAGLALDSAAGILKGGVNGRAAVPEDGKSSLLIQRLQGEGGKPKMPMGFGPLGDRDIALVKAWIDQGCAALDKSRPATHWAYIKPVRPRVPSVSNPAWPRNPIDAFVLHRLDQERLKPSPEADKVTLIRRVTLDLTGLPPTPAEVDAFMADRSPNAYEKVVDRLFASPHYGERMALPWLDAARYADSNGFQTDGDTFQYVWRDWVVKALNDNMPFDRFTIEQLAGDLLPDPTRDDLIATAFNRNHMLNGEGGAIPEEQRNIAMFDRVETTSTTWLGLTMTCDRCHDHKYDPFTQRDYYSLMAYFNQVPETGVTDTGGQYNIAEPWIYVGTDAQMEHLRRLEPEVTMANEAKLTEKARALQKELDDLKKTIPRVMVMSDRRPRETFIYSRGNYEAHLAQVQPATPAVLTPAKEVEAKNRLGLAKWIVSPDNPLTARVQVNRYWQTFFGRGLVRTPENFGVQGEPPTHPELLDWLAVEFRESGWDVKRLQRLIVTSATYRQGSKVPRALNDRDPDNRLLARGARFRLPSTLLRDVALSASGLLNPRMGGKPVYPYQPKGIWDGLNITDERDFTYPQSKGADLYRRSLYTFWRRTAAPGDMFDSATRQTCTVRVSQTSTPLHALTMLNDVAWVEAGRALGESVLRDSPPKPEARLAEAFRRVCARRPDKQELAILGRSLNRALKVFRADPKLADQYLAQGDKPRDTKLDPAEEAAYATVCLAILNLDEAMTRE